MNCPICDSQNLKKGEKYNIFTLNTCENCGVIFWNPLKHPGKDFYETSELHEVKGEKKLQWRHKQFLKNPILKSGKFLDIACGTGEFLNEVKNLGFDVWGIDIAERQINFAKKNYGFKNVFTSTVEKFIETNPPKFDAVSFFEVLEHLDNPKEFLRNVKKILSFGGYLILSVPNADRVGVGKESEETPPNHLFRWRKDPLAKFLKQEGFEIIKIVEQPFSKEFFFTTGFFSFGIVKKLRGNRAKNSDSQIILKNNSSINKIAGIKELVLMPIAAISALFMRILGYKYWDLYIVAKLK